MQTPLASPFRPPSTALAGLLGMLVAASTVAQQATDWNDVVRKAIEHHRYGVRHAASKRLADAGDDAVPAIRAYRGEHGPGSLPLLLVDAIARADTTGPATLALLDDWAADRRFYWSSQALGGLANRHLERTELFRRAVREAAYLCRIEGARGLYFTDAGAHAATVHRLVDDDPDPRVRVRLSAFLAEHGDDYGYPVLIAALRHQDTFLGDPWADRERQVALAAVTAVAGEDGGYRRGAGVAANAANAAATAALERALRAHAKSWREVSFRRAEDDFVGGVSVRSCREGDLFLRWTADGTLVAGLEPRSRVRLPAAVWQSLRARLDVRSRQPARFGQVTCDFLLLQDRPPGAVSPAAPAAAWKVAPGALPPELGDWLRALSAELRSSHRSAVADDIDGRLRQFAGARGS